MKRFFRLSFAILFLSFSTQMASAGYAGGENSFSERSTASGSGTSPRRAVATVMFAGLGGAVLGLSTLSFYGSPQEHIGNIWTGLALGIIGGAVYVTSQSRASSYDQDLGQSAPPDGILIIPTDKSSPLLGYHWSF